METEPDTAQQHPRDTPPLHKHADGKPKMLHEAENDKVRAAIIAATNVITTGHIGKKAVETLTTEAL